MKDDINWDCYWSYQGTTTSKGEVFPKIYCQFDKNMACEPCKICKYYVRRDKIDDYIHHLLDEIEILTKLP